MINSLASSFEMICNVGHEGQHLECEGGTLSRCKRRESKVEKPQSVDCRSLTPGTGTGTMSVPVDCWPRNGTVVKPRRGTRMHIFSISLIHNLENYIHESKK
jgi:hypothetical protein